MLRIERGAGIFLFLDVFGGIFDALTQEAPLHFTESDDNQPNRKRSREAAHRLHDTVNRGTVQSIRADSRYFMNPATIDFFSLILRPFSPKITENSARSQGVYSFI